MEDHAFDQPYATKRIDGGGQIPRELATQAGSLEQLHATIGELEMRTQAIRIPRPEVAGMHPDSPAPVRSEVANEIAERTVTIEAATRRLNTLLHELEL